MFLTPRFGKSIYHRRRQCEAALPRVVPVSAHSLDKFSIAPAVDLIAQSLDEGIDRVRLHILFESPDRLDDRGAGSGVARPAHEEFQQAKFSRCESHATAAAPHF